MSSSDFILKGIDLRGLLVMDAGAGAANTTLWLAKKLKEAGGGESSASTSIRRPSWMLKGNWANLQIWLSL